jgi:hypothetical protein
MVRIVSLLLVAGFALSSAHPAWSAPVGGGAGALVAVAQNLTGAQPVADKKSATMPKKGSGTPPPKQAPKQAPKK